MVFNRAIKLAAVLLGTVAAAACQTQPGPKAPELPRYSSAEFALTETRLPPNYHGHDFRHVYAVLDKRSGQLKGEFESSADYEKRIAAQAAQPVVGKMTTGSLYAFELWPITSYYDADTELLDAKVEEEHCGSGRCAPYLTLGTWYARAPYTELRSNAYGANREGDGLEV